MVGELSFFSNSLAAFLTDDEKTIGENLTLNQSLGKYPIQYTKLSLERRAQVFDAITLATIESSYQKLYLFCQVYPKEFRKFVEKQITLDDFRNNLDISGLKPIIDEAIRWITKKKTADDT